MYLLPQDYEKEERMALIKKHLDEGLTFEEVGKLFRVTGDTIKYHWKRYGLKEDQPSLKEDNSPSSHEERNQEIFWERIIEGTTLEKLANKHDVTRERIRQIVAKEARKLRRKHQEIDNIKEIARRSAEHCLRVTAILKKTYGIDKVFGRPSGGVKIYNIGLTVRTANCLKNEGIKYLDQLECYSEADLLRTPNFGRKSLNEIKNIMRDYNYTIGSKT
ncbi:MAG: hypothetical protein E3J54_01920 [Actinobacteria bacterium]|nr:MAG: hypothetical protein E3J54_01920 [Actinomycetota bacterium]